NEQQSQVDKFPLELHDEVNRPPLNPKRSLLPVIVALLVLVAVAGAWTFWTKHKARENAAESQGSPASKSPDQLEPAPATLPSNSSNGAGSPVNPITGNP